MKRKLDLIKSREGKEPRSVPVDAVLKLDVATHTQAIEGVKESVDELKEFFEEKEDFDFDKLYQQLDELGKRADISSQLELLAKNIADGKVLSVEGLDEVMEAIKAIKPETKVIKEEDIFNIYKPADSEEEKESQKYYGFLAMDGAWFIMRENGEKNKQWRYANGKGKYSEAWSNRLRQKYQYFDEISI